MLMLIPVFWCPTYMSPWCQSYIQKPSSRSSFLATEDMSWWNIGTSLQVEPLFMSNYNCYLKKKNNFRDLTCAIVHCICEWAHEDEEWHLTTLLPFLHIICQITLPKLENMTRITAEWDNWISLYQRLQFYRHVLWNLDVTEWQLLIFFLCFVLFIRCRLAVSLLLLLCVWADTGTRAHLHSTAHFTAVITDLSGPRRQAALNEI